jgi:GNAT superfamily N-acetyltransferase
MNESKSNDLNAGPGLELHASPPRPGIEPRIIEYDVVSGGQDIGNAELGLAPEKNEISIDWFTIHNDLQGKGYGKRLWQDLIQNILTEYPWAETIVSPIDAEAALGSAIAMPFPKGWHRTFFLKEHQSGDSGELYIPAGQTEDPESAVDFLKSRGVVTLVLKKADQQ